jgi:hypothetical protein
MWLTLREDLGQETPYATVDDKARCLKVDANLYKIGEGDTALYYYKLNCGGTVGFVETDQVAN